MPNPILVPAIIFVPENTIYIGLINLCNVISDIPVLVNVIIYTHLYPFTYLRKVKQFIKTNCRQKENYSPESVLVQRKLLL